MELFTQGEANKILSHIIYTTSREWLHAGLFQWHDGPENGRGQHRLYSRLNLYQIALCDYLMRNTRYKADALRKVMTDFFVKNDQDEMTIIDKMLKEPFLVIKVKGKSVVRFYGTEKDLSDMFLNPMSYTVLTTVINLNLLMKEVDDSIKNNLI